MKTNFIITNGDFLSSTEESVAYNPYDSSPVSKTYLINKEILGKIIFPENIRAEKDIFFTASKSVSNNKGTIAELATLETGAPISFSEKEVDECVHYLQSLAGLEENFQEYIAEPKGSVLISGAANQPITSVVNPLIAALYNGNNAVVRPSTHAPSSVFEVVKCLLDAGLRKDSIAFAPFGKAMTETVFSNPNLSAVFWTGGMQSTREVGPLALKYGKEFISESEGNDWCVADSSCDLEETAKIVFTSFTANNGQMCNSVRGVFVGKDIYQEFLELLRAKITRVKIGNPMHKDTDIGPLQSESQVNDIVSKIRETKSNVFGFEYNRNILHPTLVEDPPLSARLVTEGFFGPVLWIKPVEDIRDAALFYKKYNKFGLSFSVFSSYEDIQKFFISQIKCGMMHINNNPTSVGLSEPWGGCKLSGFGGAKGWSRKFVDMKYVIRGDSS